jgi:formylglycine-generating enzyme required for sulfatase activity
MPYTPLKIHPKLEKTELVLVPGGTFIMGGNDPKTSSNTLLH